MGLAEWLELGQSGGLFAFAWVVYQEVRELRRLHMATTETLAAIEERTRRLPTEEQP